MIEPAAQPESDTTSCRLLAFGMLSNLPGIHSGDIPHFPDTDRFRAWLMEQCPELQRLVFALALNRVIVQQNTEIPAGAELALLPPFSGG
jgi:molybdopterin synthase sulfur carrier subunit